MKDMFGTELQKGDLVAYAARRGSSSAIFLSIVIDTEKKGILSGRCGWSSDKFVANVNPGYGVHSNKLILIAVPTNLRAWGEEYSILKEKAKKYL